MHIDVPELAKNCPCGKEHAAETKLCIIENGALQHFEQYMDRVGLHGKRCVIYDENTYRAVPQALHPAADQEIIIPGSGIHADEHATADVLARMDEDVEVMVAVGTGILNDVVRYCARERHIPFAAVPTAATCDAFASSVAAMTLGGLKVSITCQSPVLVVADVDIVRDAPADLILSGIGDMLGKFVALAEWRMAHLLTGEALCERIYDMMFTSVSTIWDKCLEARQGDDAAIAAVMEGLIMSGIAMQLFGNSRPASGAEHHFSHLLDIGTDALRGIPGGTHGEQVGVGTAVISREYHRLIAMEDITPYLHDYAAPDEDYVRAFVGDKLFAGVMKENAKDSAAGVTKEKLAACWPEIRKIMAAIPAPDEVEAKLGALGAKKDLHDLGIAEERLGEILTALPLARNRLTLMRLKRMMSA